MLLLFLLRIHIVDQVLSPLASHPADRLYVLPVLVPHDQLNLVVQMVDGLIVALVQSVPEHLHLVVGLLRFSCC